jgi:hypothetical protein
LQFDHKNLELDFSYDETQYLNTELTKLGIETHIEEDAIVFTNSKNNIEHQATTYTLSKLPKSYALYNTADFLAHIDKNASITCPHIFSIAFKLMPLEKSKAKAKSKYFSLEKQANSILARYFTKLKDQFEEWSYVRNQLDRDEIRLAEVYTVITLFSEKENHAKYKSQFESTMQACAYGGFEVTAPSKIQFPLFKSNFPGMIAEGMWKDLKKSITCASAHHMESC